MVGETLQNVVGSDDGSNKSEMFTRIIDNGIVVKSQQIDEADLTEQEKLNYLQEIYNKNRQTFLLRYGKYLNLSDLKNFDDADKSSDLFYYVQKLKEILNPKENSTSKLKNRRYNYLQKTLRNSDYFSDEDMKFRNPLLYRQYIEQYKTESDIKKENEKDLSQSTLSQFLFGTMDKKLHEFRCNLEKEIIEGGEEEEEEEDEEEEDEEFQNYMNEKIAITDEEKERLKKEFISLMEEQFINGDDKFDYSKIDNDESYDDICDQDMEDTYFNGDDDDENEILENGNMDYDY